MGSTGFSLCLILHSKAHRLKPVLHKTASFESISNRKLLEFPAFNGFVFAISHLSRCTSNGCGAPFRAPRHHDSSSRLASLLEMPATAGTARPLREPSAPA